MPVNHIHCCGFKFHAFAGPYLELHESFINRIVAAAFIGQVSLNACLPLACVVPTARVGAPGRHICAAIVDKAGGCTLLQYASDCLPHQHVTAST